MVQLVVIILTVLVAAPAAAKELPIFFEGVRPLGMGGAFTAVADDENAVFYNPAGLDKMERWGLGIVNPLVEIGEDGYDFAQDAIGTDFDEAGEVADLIRDHVGETEHFRAALFPHFVTRHFEIGVLGQLNTSVQPNNVANPEMEVEGLQTISGHLGVGWGFFDDILRVGGGLKVVKAYRISQVYRVSDITSDDFDEQVEDDLKDDFGVGADLGAMVAFPVVLNPTVAVVLQNIADTDLGDAGKLPQQLNLGLSASHAFSWLTLIGAADWVDATTQLGEDDDFYKRLHIGLEARFPKVLSLRGGLNQGYWTLGAALDLWALRLDYATYAEEIGSSAGDRDDRRHVLQATLGW